MAKAPGLPKIVLAPYSVPTFNSPIIQNGGEITSIIIENLNDSVSINHPFTIGHPFKQGELKMSDSLVGKISGKPDLLLQFDPKATWPDGSLRHAYISGVMPTIGAKEKITVKLTRSTATRDNTPVAASVIAASSIKAKATVVINGTTYTADADEALISGVGRKLRMAGPVCTEYSVTLPLKTTNGAQHRVLRAVFDIRYYNANKAKIDITLENGLFYYEAGNNQPTYVHDVTYDVALSVGGSVFYSKSGLSHWAAAVWMESVWFGGESSLHVRFDRMYLQDTKMIPNYDPNMSMSEANIVARYGTPFKAVPMSNGEMYPHMASSGAHEDIAIHPRWCAEWIVSQDPRVKQRALENAKAGGSWETHMRDDTGGPSTGNPIDVLHLPRASYVTGLGDTINYETDLYEHVNFQRPGASAAGFSIDVPHHPTLATIPYMLTGDRFYEDEMLFWANFITWNSHPDYREEYKGLFKAEPQIRGQAWSFRTVAYCAAMLPDTHPQKPFHHNVLAANFAWYDAIYPDNPNSSPLGLFDHVGPSGEGEGITKPWMDDFVTQTLNVIKDLGFTAATKFLTWKAKFPVGRMTAPGVCWITAAEYMYRWRETDSSSSYTSFAEAYDGTARARFPEILGKACGSLEMAQALGKQLAGDMSNNSGNAMGYGANMQPALAAAVDIGYPNAQAAWDQFQQRAVKPNYAADGMQFNIVPRAASTVVPPLKTVSLNLCDPLGNILSNLGTLNWAWFDSTSPLALGSPTDKGSIAVPDVASLTFVIANSTKVAGEHGTLIISDSNGDSSISHKSFSGIVDVT